MVSIENVYVNHYKVTFEENKSNKRTVHLSFNNMEATVTYGSYTVGLDFSKQIQFIVQWSDGGSKRRDDRIKIKRAVLKDMVNDIVSTINQMHKEYNKCEDNNENFTFWYSSDINKSLVKEIKSLLKDYITFERVKYNEKRFIEHLINLASDEDVYGKDYIIHEFKQTHGNLKYFVVPNTGNIWSEDIKAYFLVKADACLQYKEILSKVNKYLHTEPFAHVRDFNKNSHAMGIPKLSDIPEV
jgi:PhoPQ-activated pathogenicity-related protein